MVKIEVYNCDQRCGELFRSWTVINDDRAGLISKTGLRKNALMTIN